MGSNGIKIKKLGSGYRYGVDGDTIHENAMPGIMNIVRSLLRKIRYKFVKPTDHDIMYSFVDSNNEHVHKWYGTRI